jgi:hypothetical protein
VPATLAVRQALRPCLNRARTETAGAQEGWNRLVLKGNETALLPAALLAAAAWCLWGMASAGTAAWADYVQLFDESRLVHASSLDFALFTALVPFWMSVDADGRQWAPRQARAQGHQQLGVPWALHRRHACTVRLWEGVNGCCAAWPGASVMQLHGVRVGTCERCVPPPPRARLQPSHAHMLLASLLVLTAAWNLGLGPPRPPRVRRAGSNWCRCCPSCPWLGR